MDMNREELSVITDLISAQMGAEVIVDVNSTVAVVYDVTDANGVAEPNSWQLLLLVIPLILIVILIVTLRNWT